MEWTQVLTIIGVMAAMFYHLSNKTDARISAIEKEMKDFHGRLCTLEEKYFQWLMRDKKE